MKGLITYNLGSFLLVLIISLSCMVIAKSFAEKGVLVSAAKVAIIEGIVNNSNLSESEKNAITNITKDSDSTTIIKRAFENFFDYISSDDYNLTNDDYDFLMDYIIKYKDEMNILSESDYTESQIRDLLPYDEANDLVKDSFDDMDGNMSSQDANKIVSIYKKITSVNAKKVVIISMMVIVLLITLINWDFFKWIVVMGIDLVISGIFFGSLYLLGLFLRSKASVSETLLAIIKSLNINVLLWTAILELTIGVLLIIGYKFIKKNNNSQINETNLASL